nr:uncharacterized protein LOC4325276 [Oryza sativa Japonica Group]
MYPAESNSESKPNSSTETASKAKPSRFLVVVASPLPLIKSQDRINKGKRDSKKKTLPCRSDRQIASKQTFDSSTDRASKQLDLPIYGSPRARTDRARITYLLIDFVRSLRLCASMLELLLVGCSSVVLLLHGANFLLRALFARRGAVARPISFLGFVA